METTTVIKAWHTSPEYLNEADLTNPERLSFTNHDMSNMGWLEVGHAEIKLTRTLNRTEIVRAMVDKLEGDIVRVQSEAGEKITEMRRRINDLLLLGASNDPL